MQGKHPRTIYVVLTNPLPGKEAEFNYWYNYVHVPDGLAWGIFDRVYRYKALDERAESFLAIWESDYVDLTEGLKRADRETEELAERGRLWPVFERAWSCPFSSVGPAAPPSRREVTCITTVQVNCPSDYFNEFSQWRDQKLIGRLLANGDYHTAYGFERTGEAPSGEAKFLTIFEGDLDSVKLKTSSPGGDIFAHQDVERSDENHLKVINDTGKSPTEFMIEVKPEWVTTWAPVWP